MSTRVLPDSIQLATPAEWDEFPIDLAEFTDFRRRTIAKMSSQGQLDRASIRQVELFLVDLHRTVQRENVIFAAGYLAQQPPAVEGGEPTPVMAAVAATSVHRSDFGTDLPLLPEVLLQAFAEGQSRREREAAEGDGADGEAGASITFDHVEPPVTVEVGGMEAVRLLRLMRSTAPHRDPRSLFLETYLIPVAKGDAVIMVQFTTANLDLAKPLSKLFGHIADSIRVLYPDDPTFIDDTPIDLSVDPAPIE